MKGTGLGTGDRVMNETYKYVTNIVIPQLVLPLNANIAEQ